MCVFFKQLMGGGLSRMDACIYGFFSFFLPNDTPIAEKACEMVEMGVY